MQKRHMPPMPCTFPVNPWIYMALPTVWNHTTDLQFCKTQLDLLFQVKAFSKFHTTSHSALQCCSNSPPKLLRFPKGLEEQNNTLKHNASFSG